MDYETLYNKALERARKYKKYGYMMINVALDNIFPELKESKNGQKTWKDEIIDIAKQYIIEPNNGDYEKSDIEKMTSTKKLDSDLIAYLCEYIAYPVTNRYGNDLAIDEIADKIKSKSKKEAYLKLEDYDESNKELIDLIIIGLLKGLKQNPNFPE